MPIVALSGFAVYPAAASRSRLRTMARGKNFNPARETAAAAAAPSPSSAKPGKAAVAAAAADGINVAFDPKPRNTTGEAIVDTYGPSIPGEHKWLGAAVADDGNIYGVPSHNRRVVRVVPGTGEVTELGDDDTLGDRKYKFLRGIRTKAGTILGIPAWATSVLEITPATGEVTTIGDLRPPDGNMKKWKWMWHGAAAGLDGNIYGIPSNANEVLKVDPVTREVTRFGAESMPPGQNKWYGGIRGPDGAIYGIPYTANHVLKIVPETQEVIMLGDLSDVSGGWKWHGGTRSGDAIIGIPSHAEAVLKIVPGRNGRPDELTLLGGGFKGRYQWGGAVTDNNGIVWAVPSDTDFVLRIDPASNTVARVGDVGLRCGQCRAQRLRRHGGRDCTLDCRWRSRAGYQPVQPASIPARAQYG